MKVISLNIKFNCVWKATLKYWKCMSMKDSLQELKMFDFEGQHWAN